MQGICANEHPGALTWNTHRVQGQLYVVLGNFRIAQRIYSLYSTGAEILSNKLETLGRIVEDVIYLYAKLF